MTLYLQDEKLLNQRSKINKDSFKSNTGCNMPLNREYTNCSAVDRFAEINPNFGISIVVSTKLSSIFQIPPYFTIITPGYLNIFSPIVIVSSSLYNECGPEHGIRGTYLDPRSIEKFGKPALRDEGGIK